MIDCANIDNKTFGCDGGDIQVALDFIRTKGLNKDSEYPYTATKGQCMADTRLTVTKISSWEKITPFYSMTSKSEIQAIENAVLRGVVIATIDAYDLMFYKRGIFDAKCSQDINHLVVIVGFGETTDDDPEGPGIGYWIVKNSWGTDWGEEGYIRIRKGGDGHPQSGFCGLYQRTYLPVIKS